MSTPSLPPLLDPLPLDVGSCGEPVRDLQRRLSALEIDPGASDGVFDDDTHRAILTFQDQRGLHQTGVCDATTWSTLVEAGYRLGDRLLYLRSPMVRGDDVADLQLRLGALGFDTGRVDAIFGPDTERALKEFERNTGLTIDGVCGRDVIAALDRLGSRSEHTTSVAHVRERERLRQSPRDLDQRRVALGGGGFAPLMEATARVLHDAGAITVVLPHPDPSSQATEANEFSADAFVGIELSEVGPCRIAFYARPGYESAGGHHLADLIVAELRAHTAFEVADACPMRIPVLRETRMPAVVCHLGPPAGVVQASAQMSSALATALGQWCGDPLQP